ncbi:radical SAM domain protein [Sphingobacterium spiritivorum ATCC 33300]|uniref:Radical SAM domain protein n=1 Tax=Sphingobacterium spiritivorum ATCC 33300 TaxID=525372 RepID=C2FYD4_SPHSI|nr:PA0069 family radical SAM protein [Sphingobacterium spiritivorum]EEI92187.1 radical SAM domain protein [Sphingobacterium spiritivorum ATCC 33300]QQS96564.1 PA0069 family radical SAM protein [Sphingobacterium spiritivorum]
MLIFLVFLSMEESNYFKGRGAQVNPNNKFFVSQYVQEHIEGLDEPFLEHVPTQLIPTHPKKIISVSDSPDLHFTQSINPYQGCEHGCIYCYARNAHEYWGFSAGLDFERKILVKYDAARLLEKQFNNVNYQPSAIMLSGNTDCYQPIERKLKITRSILEIMLRYRHPVSIISKNSLMLRDLDIIEELAKLQLISVAVTINSLSEEVRQKMEPRTVTASARLKLIEKLAGKGVPVMLMVAPIVPGINSDEMPLLIKSAAAAGARSASYTIVRLNGAIADIFKDWLYKNYPDRADKVLHGIADCHNGKLNDSEFGRRIRGEGNLAESIRDLFRLSVKQHMGKNDHPTIRTDLFQVPNRGRQLGLF